MVDVMGRTLGVKKSLGPGFVYNQCMSRLCWILGYGY